MSLRLVVEPHLCTGCRSCELACAFTHGQNGRPGASRCITISKNEEEHVSVLCLQCDHAACVKVCPVTAITQDEATRIVHVDQDICIQCQACTVACPFGNMQFDPATNQVAKCDLCATHGGYPRCTLFCPTKSLTVESVAT